jgi:hypothetical protein
MGTAYSRSHAASVCTTRAHHHLSLHLQFFWAKCSDPSFGPYNSTEAHVIPLPHEKRCAMHSQIWAVSWATAIILGQIWIADQTIGSDRILGQIWVSMFWAPISISI